MSTYLPSAHMSVRIVVLEIVEFGLDKISPGMKCLFGFCVLTLPPKKILLIGSELKCTFRSNVQILLKALLRLATLLRAC